MTETIKQKALALVNEAMNGPDYPRTPKVHMDNAFLHEALCRAIEQHEAYKQEVSDALEYFMDGPVGLGTARERLGRFIIAKTDPLVEVIVTALREGSPFDEDGSHDYTAEAKVIAAAIRARGLEIREKQP